MRPLTTLLLLAALSVGCAQSNPGTPPGSDRFYYPTGVAWLPDPDGGGPGYIYVVSSDFDLRFNRGTVAAVDIATIEPALELTDAGSTPPQLDAGMGAFISSIVKIDPFGGPLAVMAMPGGGTRLFVAGRESNVLQAIDVDGTTLTCVANDAGNDCFPGGVILASSQLNQERDAYRPFITSDGQVYVSHISPIDHPYGSNTNFTATLAFVDGMTLAGPDWVEIGPEASDGLAQVGDLLYFTGRAFTGDTNVTPLRHLDIRQPTITVVDTSLAVSANVLDSRGLAASSDGTRLYMAIRDPDALLVLDMTPGLDGYPVERVINLAELPSGADEVAVIPRPGSFDAVAVSCTDDGAVALYDDALQSVTAVVHGVGIQPSGVAVATRPLGGARLFVTAFGQGSVAVIDIPTPSDLSQSSVVATWGPNENCLSDNVAARPPGCP